MNDYSNQIIDRKSFYQNEESVIWKIPISTSFHFLVEQIFVLWM